MAEQDIADIAATVDGDTTWGDDMRGAIATIADTRRPLIVGKAIGTTRTNSSASFILTAGPWFTPANTAALVAGDYTLGLSWVRGGTPDTVSIRLITNAVTSNVYYVMYNLDADGHPSTLAYSWGPFDVTVAAGEIVLTGQTTTIAAGMYWVGTMCPTGNGGSPVLWGARPCYYNAVRTFTFSGPAIQLFQADATPAATLTSSIRSSGSNESSTAAVALFAGKDT